MNIPLEIGRKFADSIILQIAPFCEKAEVAGSIRRGRPVVHDIDIVCIPLNLEDLRRRCLSQCSAITHGDSNFSVEARNGVQIDFFVARPAHEDLVSPLPSTWGSVLLCRTGSKEFNVYLCERARELGLRWNPSRGIIGDRGEIVASETEEEIFTALKLEYVAPEHRERG